MFKHLMQRLHQFSFARFLVSGGFNTALTYVIYLVALHWLDYTWSYSLAYGIGILLAFVLNKTYVFKTDRGWKSMVLFPLVYLAQYLISLGVLHVWVERLQWPAELAPLIAIAISLPVTFVLSRLVFGSQAAR
jgi:putative flippase GtrA